ncbi:bstEII [Spirosoma montaniterrae]|uniref:BstEII n=1 Tax=Spirosoma montaniterrae TaxID=1178516 RepID=A0A1P9WWG1_9BACT|nr:bstEII [Spirosoma montaniterrae]AQG79725.1 bstEII [Spirosoma montaniterrae]
MTTLPNSFGEYKDDAHNWITLASGEYYPDILFDACELYKPVLVLFGQILRESESSKSFFLNIASIKEQWMRIQLSRVFRKYVSPETPVEMLKKKTQAQLIVERFGDGFRPINVVQARYSSRPIPDEAICAILWEYKDRGKKGYDLTEKMFSLLKEIHPELTVIGPKRAGRDILMKEVFSDYPNQDRPIDFVIKEQDHILAIGLARYDSDRGGAQEDDRTGGYANCANEFAAYARQYGLNTKVIFINDGPGLLLGSMWNDYTKLESSWKGRIMVATLRMVQDRITREWLYS